MLLDDDIYEQWSDFVKQYADFLNRKNKIADNILKKERTDQNNNLLSDSERTSRRKESRRGMDRDKESGNENINHSSETTSKAAGKKSADGVSKNNGKIGSGVGEKTKKSVELQEGTKKYLE